MTQLLNKTVATIVTDNFKTAPVLEKYGIDFCCKGKKSLQSACEEKNIDPANVIRDLQLIGANSDDEETFKSMSPAALIRYIVAVHHQYVRENSQPILTYLSKINLKHGERYPYIKDVLACFSEVMAELEEHMRQEEEVVFPLINQVEHNNEGGTAIELKALIESMEQEHNTAGTLMEKIRMLTYDYNIPDNACTTFRLTMHLLQEFESDLHRHVHLENYLLFPKAVKIYEQLPRREV